MLREQGVALLKKYGAVAHSFGYYHSGTHAGQIFIAITYPDLATHEQAWQGMSGDADWPRVAGGIEKIAPLQESYVTGRHRGAMTAAPPAIAFAACAIRD